MGIADLALGAAPIAGGALLGLAAGGIKGPDVRAAIKADMDLLDRIPADQAVRREALQRSIDLRIDDIVTGIEKNRDIRSLAASYSGNWRDVVVFDLALDVALPCFDAARAEFAGLDELGVDPRAGHVDSTILDGVRNENCRIAELLRACALVRVFVRCVVPCRLRAAHGRGVAQFEVCEGSSDA